jgi:hypothetical protein
MLAHRAYVLTHLANACPVRWSPQYSLVRSCEVHSGISLVCWPKMNIRLVLSLEGWRIARE